MHTYYRDARIHITSSAISIDGRLHRLDQLDRIWRTRRFSAGRRVLIGVGVLAGAVALRLVGGYAWSFGGLRQHVQSWTRAGVVITMLVAIGVLTAAVVGVFAMEAALTAVEDIRGHARRLELWAVVEGQPILLLGTNDSALFGKVCRALTRARTAGLRPTGDAPG